MRRNRGDDRKSDRRAETADRSAGHVLVKEYIDDGYTGSRMDRPALQELRRDLRADVFDVIYFLAADRIARAVIYQTIIIGEMLLHKKDIVINGQQWDQQGRDAGCLRVAGSLPEEHIFDEGCGHENEDDEPD